MNPHIPSDQLTVDMVPDPERASEREIWKFFHSFHAYTHWGGVEAAHEALQAMSKEIAAEWAEAEARGDEFYRWPSVDLIRTEAFLQLRADRHQDAMDPPVDWQGMRDRLRHLLWTMK
jgi:hypothetical protein